MFPKDNGKMRDFADKCMELSEFLHKISFSPQPLPPLRATYHDCCAGLRELSIKDGPRQLLQKAGVELVEMTDCEECCGFGGTFSVKFGGIATAMADRKCRHIAETKVNTLLMGDLGCLLHVQGRLHRLGRKIRVMHWGEVLAGV